jgi:hypothetical protein
MQQLNSEILSPATQLQLSIFQQKNANEPDFDKKVHST